MISFEQIGAFSMELCYFLYLITNAWILVCKCPVIRAAPQEFDVHRLNQRQRQIEFGKNTLGYERYIETVPRLVLESACG